jgi:hypothetical protein
MNQILVPENDHAQHWPLRTDFDNELSALNEHPEISLSSSIVIMITKLWVSAPVLQKSQ